MPLHLLLLRHGINRTREQVQQAQVLVHQQQACRWRRQLLHLHLQEQQAGHQWRAGILRRIRIAIRSVRKEALRSAWEATRRIHICRRSYTRLGMDMDSVEAYLGLDILLLPPLLALVIPLHLTMR
jgi:hypothetical protein